MTSRRLFIRCGLAAAAVPLLPKLPAATSPVQFWDNRLSLGSDLSAASLDRAVMWIVESTANGSDMYWRRMFELEQGPAPEYLTDPADWTLPDPSAR